MNLLYRLTILLLALIAPLGTVAAETSLTYQGQLQLSGSFYSGEVEMSFELFDAEVAGSPVGTPVTTLVTVSESGLFQVTLDFGDQPFDQGLWLQVSVDGNTLNGRQPVTAAPLAIRSLSGGSNWELSGTTLSYPDGRVFVGRTTPINTNEYFGIRTPTGANTYGGMYVETSNETGQPFFGFATDGIARAWTYWRGADLTYRIWNGGERLTITDDGRYGFETTSPDADLHLVHEVITSASTQAGRIGLKIQNGGPNQNSWTFYTQNGIGDLYLYFRQNAVGRFDDATGAYSTISDSRSKTDVEGLPSILEAVLDLPALSYRYIHQERNEPRRSLGFLAQDVLARFPELVTGTEQDGGEGMYMVNYAGFSVVAIKAIQEQQAIIEAQAERLDLLETRIAELEQGRL